MTDNKIKQQMEILVRLQENETEIARLEAAIADAPNRIAALESRLSQEEAQAESQAAAVGQLAKAYRELEADVQMNLSKQKGKEAKLGTVKTNKEYQALLNEIEELKKQNSLIEDQMLTLLDQLEAAEKALQARKETLEVSRRDIETQKADIARQTAQAETMLAGHRKKKNEIMALLDRDFLTKYQMVHTRVPGNKVVTPVINAVCQACHMNIPPQLFNELHRWDDIYFCPHCQRIIYWKKLDD